MLKLLGSVAALEATVLMQVMKNQRATDVHSSFQADEQFDEDKTRLAIVSLEPPESTTMQMD